MFASQFLWADYFLFPTNKTKKLGTNDQYPAVKVTGRISVDKVIGGLKICFKRTEILHVLQRNVANLPVVTVFVTLGY